MVESWLLALKQEVMSAMSPGIYSVIARLELMGEAQSTAQLYLSGKGLYVIPYS